MARPSENRSDVAVIPREVLMTDRRKETGRIIKLVFPCIYDCEACGTANLSAYVLDKRVAPVPTDEEELEALCVLESEKENKRVASWAWNYNLEENEYNIHPTCGRCGCEQRWVNAWGKKKPWIVSFLLTVVGGVIIYSPLPLLFILFRGRSKNPVPLLPILLAILVFSVLTALAIEAEKAGAARRSDEQIVHRIMRTRSARKVKTARTAGRPVLCPDFGEALQEELRRREQDGERPIPDELYYRAKARDQEIREKRAQRHR